MEIASAPGFFLLIRIPPPPPLRSPQGYSTVYQVQTQAKETMSYHSIDEHRRSTVKGLRNVWKRCRSRNPGRASLGSPLVVASTCRGIFHMDGPCVFSFYVVYTRIGLLYSYWREAGKDLWGKLIEPIRLIN